jgi:hypothetical protein
MESLNAYQDFLKTLDQNHPPAGWSDLLKALWYDANEDWSRSHAIAQEIHSREGSWLHAYLHRKEGDQWNANYWYQRAQKPMPDISLDDEQKALIEYFFNHNL